MFILTAWAQLFKVSLHWRRKVQNIGRWGGSQGLDIEGPNSQIRRHVPTIDLINQCQIITFLILKSDIIENSRIELRGIVLTVPSNQIKVTFFIILPFNLVRL